MKLSLSWIFDHIQGSWANLDIPDLIKRLNKTVVEIEDYTFYEIDLTSFTAAVVRIVDKDLITVYSPELLEEFKIAGRENSIVGQLYMLKKNGSEWIWAHGKDFHSEKDSLLPPLAMTDEQLKGAWKNDVEENDYILTISNTTITHRPDLWGHRGFAREIAALLDLPLVPLDQLVTPVDVKVYDHTYKATPEAPFSLTIQDQTACKRLAACLIPEIDQDGSWFWMVHRLLRVDNKASNPFVDTANYVMLDLSQPMHVFDAAKLYNRELNARSAKYHETLMLLDGKEIELTNENLVIADGKKAVGLAGIMGGKETSVSNETRTLLIESASFNPKSIRKTAAHFKIRTESSSRFEKDLDPNQNVSALLRFLYILNKNAQLIIDPLVIVSLGKEFIPSIITITHAYIEQKLGINLESSVIQNVLSRLQFHVDIEKTDPLTYRINVPSFRGTKSIVIPDDIVEEVGRSIGFDSIPHTLPKIQTKPEDVRPLVRLDQIKHYLAFGAAMHEVRNYAVFDEEFLAKMQWSVQDTVDIINPVSTTMYRLVTSLIPNLLKNIAHNYSGNDVLNFFEFNSIFQKQNKHIYEQKSLAGVFFAIKNSIDFYEKKHILDTLFAALDIPISWIKTGSNLAPWYHPYQSAYIMHEHERVGIAGMINPLFLQRLFHGQGFIFELNGTFLLNVKESLKKYQPISKYQDTWADVSMLVPLSLNADKLKEVIQKSDPRIFEVTLIDFFQKEDWVDQRSITMRYYARAHDRTLTSKDIEALHAQVVKAVKNLGAVVR